MRILILSLAIALAAPGLDAQQASFERLPPATFDVVPPSARVRGVPGHMTIRTRACRARSDADVRRRIVDVAVQEWAFFGFSIVDQTRIDPDAPRFRRRRGFRWLSPEESARVADSIAGYWTVTPQGAWILDQQNEAWNGPDGVAARWRDPWSAAFVSWVMCESGLGAGIRFERAVAHHVYIDQAIRARDEAGSPAAFAAYDIGEADVEPGDLLCSARRPAYRTLAERRRQMGEGARTHCDIVVEVDGASGRILAIGGNVRGTVSLKLLPAARTGRGRVEPGAPLSGRGRRPLFAHLKLRAADIESDAFEHTPTVAAIGCAVGFLPPTRLIDLALVPGGRARATC